MPLATCTSSPTATPQLCQLGGSVRSLKTSSAAWYALWPLQRAHTCYMCHAHILPTGFLRQASKDIETRLPADVLLGAPWLLNNGAESIDACEKIVKNWLVENGLTAHSGGDDDTEGKREEGESKK